jgi:4'-phosphopantetheinyl transferase
MSASIKTQHVSDGAIGGYLLELDQFIDIYIVNDLDINSSYLLDTYRLIMSDEEKARSDRFYVKRDQRQFVIGRSLIRSTLSRYMPATEPQAWRFTTGPFGRPAIENTDRIYCNLAHTRGAIVLAVASTPLIGVDVENRHRRPVNVAEIAARYFCRSEYEALMALPVALRQDTSSICGR